VRAADHGSTPPSLSWSFAGPFGKFDQGQLQRGYKVYKEVCSACHSMNLVHYRNLTDPGGPGFSVAQAEALASEIKVKDGPNDAGDMFERPGRVADKFPSPFPNENAARAANGGAAPPDLSLMAKARGYERGFPQFIFDAFTQFQEKGPNYIHAILTGFEDSPPEGVTMPEGSTYNKYFPGHAMKMPNPLADDQVTYDDGTPQKVDQYAKDVSAFLMWAAEPKLEERKRIGFQVMIFMVILAGLLYFTKKAVWADAH
jgi:ubiquinol-cytochrome c reductase cytochrome b/c1 subunit